MSTIRKNISPFIPLDGGVDEYYIAAAVKNNRLRGYGKTMNIFIDNGRILKRPGYQLFGPYLYDKCYGLHEYIDPDGNARLLIVGKQKIWEITDKTLTERDSGLYEEILHLHTHRGRCWINGSNTQRKITGTTAARVGIEAPETAPTVAETGTSGLTGDYGFKYTFVIKESGVKVWESNPSTATSLVVSNKNFLITPAISGDSRVNCRRIYRTAESGNLYQEDGDIDDNTEGSTYTSSQADATLGSILEENHGVPVQGVVSEGCNERMFWLINSGSKARLYWSESAYTEPYQEYQQSTNYRELPSDGKGIWIKRLYNPNTLREDLYIGQETGIHILPGGDPNIGIANVSRAVGGTSQANVVQYGNSLVFLSNKNTVYQIKGGRLIDLSNRNIVKSISKFYETATSSKAGLIYDHYYALSGKNTPGAYHQDIVWICDLRTIKEYNEGYAIATWFPWDLPLSYILQRNDGTVIAYNEYIQRLIQLSFTNNKDEYGDLFFTEQEKPVDLSCKLTGLTGTAEIQFSLYAAATGGSALWSETHTFTLDSTGLFTIKLGQQNAIPLSIISGLASGTKYYLEISVTQGGATFEKRIQIPLRAYLHNKITTTAVGGANYVFLIKAVDITAKFATRFFGAENPSARRIISVLRLSGKQQRKISVTPVYQDYYTNDGTEADMEREQGGLVMVDDGTTVWASPTTQIAMNMSVPLEPGEGGAVSFEFKKADEDVYFECEGIQYHYTEMRRY